MKISVAIPNYNGSKQLGRLLKQLINESFYKVFVIDDVSTDGSRQIIKSFPVILIKNKKNLGPTATRNQILSEDFGDVIVFIDVDIRVVTKDLKSAVENLFEKYPDTAVFGGKILLRNGSRVKRNYGIGCHPLNHLNMKELISLFRRMIKKGVFISYMGSFITDGIKRLLSSFKGDVDKKVSYVLEGLFIVKGSIFKKLGGFDEDFKMYHEGPDYCRRVIEEGWEVRYTPSIVVEHLEFSGVGDKTRSSHISLSSRLWYEKHLQRQNRNNL